MTGVEQCGGHRALQPCDGAVVRIPVQFPETTPLVDRRPPQQDAGRKGPARLPWSMDRPLEPAAVSASSRSVYSTTRTQPEQYRQPVDPPDRLAWVRYRPALL